MRPINAVVDVSNYVMLDLGQPNHAYDLERLGGGGILVPPGPAGRGAGNAGRHRAGARVRRTASSATPTGVAVGVGGIMGGASAEIATDTRRVLLEAAWFTPMAIARTGKRLGLHSEARVRFERGVDPEVAPAAVARFVSLLASVAAERAGAGRAQSGRGRAGAGRGGAAGRAGPGRGRAGGGRVGAERGGAGRAQSGACCGAAPWWISAIPSTCRCHRSFGSVPTG